MAKVKIQGKIQRVPSIKSDHHQNPKPLNSFMLFKKSQKDYIAEQYACHSSSDVSSIAGAIWKAMSDEEKRPYIQEYEEQIDAWNVKENDRLENAVRAGDPYADIQLAALKKKRDGPLLRKKQHSSRAASLLNLNRSPSFKTPISRSQQIVQEPSLACPAAIQTHNRRYSDSALVYPSPSSSISFDSNWTWINQGPTEMEADAFMQELHDMIESSKQQQQPPGYFFPSSSTAPPFPAPSSAFTERRHSLAPSLFSDQSCQDVFIKDLEELPLQDPAFFFTPRSFSDQESMMLLPPPPPNSPHSPSSGMSVWSSDGDHSSSFSLDFAAAATELDVQDFFKLEVIDEESIWDPEEATTAPPTSPILQTI